MHPTSHSALVWLQYSIIEEQHELLHRFKRHSQMAAFLMPLFRSALTHQLTTSSLFSCCGDGRRLSSYYWMWVRKTVKPMRDMSAYLDSSQACMAPLHTKRQPWEMSIYCVLRNSIAFNVLCMQAIGNAVCIWLIASAFAVKNAIVWYSYSAINGKHSPPFR